MAAATFDFDIEQGATLIRPFRWRDGEGTPIDMTGCKARMQCRPTVSSGNVLLQLTTENGGIELDPTDGLITLTFTAEMTAAITWKKAKYDLEIVAADGVVVRLLQGVIHVSREVTRAIV